LEAAKAAAKEKATEKATPAKKAAVEGIASLISIDDFAKVQLRVAQVKSCEPVKRAKKLLCLQLDDGTDTPRQVVSGIHPWYEPEQLIGKKLVVVANLKPATLCGVESNGMILAADAGENDVKVIFVDDTIPCGATVR
jgi:methionyl-tRNA synthetase